MILQNSQHTVLGSLGTQFKRRSPVREDGEKGAENRTKPVNPVVAREMAVDDGGTE
jgi:hypothetical protein